MNWFQQLGCIGSSVRSPIVGLGKDFGQNATQMQENNVQFNIFWNKILILNTFTDSLKNIL